MADLHLARPVVPLPLGPERLIPAALLEDGDYVTEPGHPRGGWRVLTAGRYVLTGGLPVVAVVTSQANGAQVGTSFLLTVDAVLRVRRPVSCTCGYPGPTAGPERDCPTHGEHPHPAAHRG